MSREYDQIYEGKWTRWEKRKDNRLQCCDCSLVHLIEFRVAKDGQIETRMFLDQRSTAAIRRALGITVVRKKPKRRRNGNH